MPNDTVLDVACGPGLMACEFAAVARHVTGIDLTPAMIERARAQQESQGQTNVSWLVGDVLPLPFPGSSFSLVFTRYSVPPFPRAEDGPCGDGACMFARRTRRRGGCIHEQPRTSRTIQPHGEVCAIRSHVRALSLAELVELFRRGRFAGSWDPLLQTSSLSLSRCFDGSFPKSR